MVSVSEVDAHTLADWLDAEPSLQLIDVRSPAEFAQGMIPQGELLPLHLLPLRSQEFDREKPTVLYCRSGARSAQGCMFLTQHGFRRVFNLRGGILDWARHGLPVGQSAAA